jgi:hypothetical protein
VSLVVGACDRRTRRDLGACTCVCRLTSEGLLVAARLPVPGRTRSHEFADVVAALIRQRRGKSAAALLPELAATSTIYSRLAGSLGAVTGTVSKLVATLGVGCQSKSCVEIQDDPRPWTPSGSCMCPRPPADAPGT